VSDGAAEAARFRRPRYDLRDRRDHVRGVSGEAIRAAAALEAPRSRRTIRAQVRPRLLRIRRQGVSELVRVETEDGIRTITVDRPEKLNALNADVLSALDRALEEASRDRALRCVIVTGAGDKAFIAGADIGELAKLSPVEGREHARRGQAVVDRLERLPV